jgi:hypothetical protein
MDFLVVEIMHRFYDGLGEVVGPRGHIVHQVILELLVSCVVGALQVHAQQILLSAHLLCLLKLCRVRWVEISLCHSLCQQLCPNQSWFSTKCTSIGFNFSDQHLEVLGIVSVGHVVLLVERGHMMLGLFESPSALLMVIEMTALPRNDEE